MIVYKIYLNDYPSSLNGAYGDEYQDIYDPSRPVWGFKSGRMAQKVIKDFKKQCVNRCQSLESCKYSVVRGEFVPYPYEEV